MYAVISTGGKQYRVEKGERLEVERLGDEGTELELKPVLLVDGETITYAELDRRAAAAAGLPPF